MTFLDSIFWQTASGQTLLLTALYLGFPLIATLAAWRKDGVVHFKLLFFFGFLGWLLYGLILESWVRDREALQPSNGEGFFGPYAGEGFKVLFFGFLFSLLYYVLWQALLLLPREAAKTYRRNRSKPATRSRLR